MKERLVLAFVIGVGLGAITLYVGQMMLAESATTDDSIAEFYRVENAVSISPHGLRGKMDAGDDSYLLVDLRSAEEYKEEHVIGAVNVPAYSDRYTSAYGEVDRIVNSFKELKEEYSGRDIIVYCYSSACMTGRKIGGILAEHGIYVKHLNIGWYEWRHDWNSWNHEHEWETDKVEEYIWSGEEPGVPKPSSEFSPCTEGEFGC
ncbi:hypothetical protein COU14_00555 [Candidatus Kaiserbacteria bacterium CG10_big_fil_rev_8_21_14_0_10_44_10]|uniref:Rhodanese domain-containing protein n=1 Tax=Candidatus Kaiserbacteria bacterium CG10_big_fil_rev_8_21_14_0_10_44_10 TaxID=1974606 RepID=A0A2H0UIA4_9BACT|nr:MAG: hypothetical protein COU14_00555 [Candidatus Kaiserbacteria bacterium CG10_big_fil_rev_8_21_14_0_10_44_10]